MTNLEILKRAYAETLRLYVAEANRHDCFSGRLANLNRDVIELHQMIEKEEEKKK